MTRAREERVFLGSLPLRAALMSSAVSLIIFAPAYAQEATTQPGVGQLEEVIVTARRVSENLQRVPITVTALGAEGIERGGVTDQYTLLSQVPGLQHYVKAGAGAASGAKVRGVQGIAYYFGGIPFPAEQWVGFSPFFDVQNVQVLKGPQGTLFGQASNSGAILAEPTRPGNDFGGYIEVKAGNYAMKSIEGAIDLPIVADKVMLRIAVADYFRNGYIQDIIGGSRIGEDNYDIVRGTLVIRPNGRVENTTLLQMERIRNTSTARVVNAYNNNPTAPRLAAGAAINGMTVAQYLAARDRLLAEQIALGPYKVPGYSTGCPATDSSPATTSTVPGPNLSSVIPQACSPFEGGRAHNNAVINTTTFDLTDNLSLKNILGFTWGKSRGNVADNDFTRLILQDSNPRDFIYKKQAQTWSEELQLIGDVGLVDFVAGVFTTHTLNKPTEPNFAQFIGNLASSATNTQTNNRSWAVYGQGNFDLASVAEGLSATAGVRWTKDHFIRTNIVLDPTTLVQTRFTGGRGTEAGDGTWKAITYTLGLQYQFNEQTMVYFTNSKGYSSGGLQNIPGYGAFDPDSLNNFEVGLKSTFDVGDWNVRTNLAAYYGLFDKVKVTQSVVYTIPGTTSQAVAAGATTNAAEAKIKGAEFELSASNGRFDVSGFVAYNEAHFTKFEQLTGTVGNLVTLDRSNDPFTNIPKWKVGFSPTFHLPVEEMNIGDVSVFAVFSFTDEFWSNFSKPFTPRDPAVPDTGAQCKVRRTAANGYGPLSADGKWSYLNCAKEWYNINVGLAWKDVLAHEGLDAQIMVNNATFFKGMRGVNSAYDGSGFNAMESNLPRFISASLRYAF